MSEGKRPGGLTALAIINFIFGGLGALGLLGMIALFAIMSNVEMDDESSRELKEALEAMGGGMLVLIVVLSVVSTVLIVIAGIGYLKQRKFMGRTLGNAWAGLSIGSSALSGLVLPVEAGGGFNLGTIIGLIYPVLTLVLLNTTFKEDFDS